MTEATLLAFDLPAVRRKKLTVDFDGGSQSSDRGLPQAAPGKQVVYTHIVFFLHAQ
jgi:hypothetical protein